MPSSGIPFPFLPGVVARFRFADALAACERVAGDGSAQPLELMRRLAAFDMQAVSISLDHALKNVGDGSPVQYDFSGEEWPISEVSEVLMAALNLLLFGEGKPEEDQALSDKLDFIEARHTMRSPIGMHVASQKAHALAEEAEAAKAEAAEEAANVEA